MAKKLTNFEATRAYVESIKRENEELKKALFDLLDYMGGSDLEGLRSGADHPLAQAWALRVKLAGECSG